MENLKLQIALAVTFFLLSIPVIISAYKSSKVIGWQVYKKIGGSIELQSKFCVIIRALFFRVFNYLNDFRHVSQCSMVCFIVKNRYFFPSVFTSGSNSNIRYITISYL
jgi:hypothetical protein